MRALLAAGLLVLLAFAAHAAGSSAPYGIGGYFARYDPIVARFNRSGELFRIEGRCQSSCTLFLGIRNVCVERSASLGFHGGHGGKGQISVSSTRHMRAAYNDRLRRYLDDHRAMETRRYFTLSGTDLIEKFGYRECPKRRAVPLPQLGRSLSEIGGRGPFPIHLPSSSRNANRLR